MYVCGTVSSSCEKTPSPWSSSQQETTHFSHCYFSPYYEDPVGFALGMWWLHTLEVLSLGEGGKTWALQWRAPVAFFTDIKMFRVPSGSLLMNPSAIFWGKEEYALTDEYALTHLSSDCFAARILFPEEQADAAADACVEQSQGCTVSEVPCHCSSLRRQTRAGFSVKCDVLWHMIQCGIHCPLPSALGMKCCSRRWLLGQDHQSIVGWDLPRGWGSCKHFPDRIAGLHLWCDRGAAWSHATAIEQAQCRPCSPLLPSPPLSYSCVWPSVASREQA